MTSTVLRSALAVFVLAAATPARAAPAPCPREGEAHVRVHAVEDRLVLRLEDGRQVRLVGLDPALGTPSAPERADEARDRLAGLLAGRSATLRLVDARPDRWGRLAGLVFPDGEPRRAGDAPAQDAVANAHAEGGAAGMAIAAGYGRYLSEPAAPACRDALLSAERSARAARLGLWGDPYYAVLPVQDDAAFSERSGTLVLAEGKLTSVQPGPFRTTLRFSTSDGAPEQASHGGRMLVATVPPRIMKLFVARAFDLDGLIGHRVRFRGLLDLRFGPQVELAGPDDIEIADQAP